MCLVDFLTILLLIFVVKLVIIKMKSVTIKVTSNPKGEKKISPQDKALAEKLFKLLIFIAKKENIIEQKRQDFCEDEEFEPRQLFEGVAGDRNSLTADVLY
jgi:membrane protein insertase Oxa1/YidC/SpoIIIJ